MSGRSGHEVALSLAVAVLLIFAVRRCTILDLFVDVDLVALHAVLVLISRRNVSKS